MGKEALVVERSILFKDKSFEGVLPIKEFDYFPIILGNYQYRARGDALEHDASLKQIIPYVWILNTQTKQLFAYRRANNPNYTETRLRNKWSCGLGGHIEHIDDADPIHQGMMRELREEVKMRRYPKPEIVGYLNVDSGDVEKVHFGILAIAKTTEDVLKGDDEMAEGRLMSLDEIERMMGDPSNDIENWTRVSWPYIRELLTKK